MSASADFSHTLSNFVNAFRWWQGISTLLLLRRTGGMKCPRSMSETLIMRNLVTGKSSSHPNSSTSYTNQNRHRGPHSMARLDRVYSNTHVVDQLHKEVFATVLDWPPHSQHRPVISARRSPLLGQNDRGIQSAMQRPSCRQPHGPA